MLSEIETGRRPTVRLVTRVIEEYRQFGTDRPQRISVSGLLQPVGSAMPSQTVHFDEELYQYIITTKGEDQSTSDRVRELAEAGKAEENHE